MVTATAGLPWITIVIIVAVNYDRLNQWVIWSRYRPGGSRSASNVIRHTIVGSQTHYEMKNIGAQSFYEIWLTASTKAGVGDKSKMVHYSHSPTGEIMSNKDQAEIDISYKIHINIFYKLMIDWA